jgi:hypothetical protein
MAFKWDLNPAAFFLFEKRVVVMDTLVGTS